MKIEYDFYGGDRKKHNSGIISFVSIYKKAVEIRKGSSLFVVNTRLELANQKLFHKIEMVVSYC